MHIPHGPSKRRPPRGFLFPGSYSPHANPAVRTRRAVGFAAPRLQTRLVSGRQTGEGHGGYLTVGTWLGVELGGSWRERNWLRSPFSMYSVIMHRGSSAMHTAKRRMMLASLSRDMIFISFRKSFLWRETHVDKPREARARVRRRRWHRARPTPQESGSQTAFGRTEDQLSCLSLTAWSQAPAAL